IVYAFLGEKPGVLFDDAGNSIYSISRDLFFYLFFAGGIIVNILFHIFRVHYLKKSRMTPISGNDQGALEILSSWWNFLILSINIFISVFLIFTALANNAWDYKFGSIALLPTLGVVPMVIALLAFPVLYLINIRNLRKRIL
ncbi:MAG TPA: hypothetical protein VI583_10990, partial [Cyclobacteriaceae bacterium]|nr:hypothetical protein [Cyclobacteriaceae bacterium]